MKSLFLGLVKYTNLTPEAIIVIALLLIILSSLFSILFFVVNAYIGFRDKQKDCASKFNGIGIEIKHVKETSDKADKRSTEAIDAVKEMKPKVDDIHQWFEDKYKKGLNNGKEEI